jgi:hypothetical protein
MAQARIAGMWHAKPRADGLADHPALVASASDCRNSQIKAPTHTFQQNEKGLQSAA